MWLATIMLPVMASVGALWPIQRPPGQRDPALHQHEEDERRLPVGQVERGGELRVHDHDLSHRGRREQDPPEPLNYVISRKMKAEREQYLLKPPNYLIHHKMTGLGPIERGAHKDRLGEECGQSAQRDLALHQHEDDERRLPVGQVERGGELRVHDHDLRHRGRREQYPPEPLNYVISRKMKAEREQYLLKPPNYLIHHKMTGLGPTERGAHKDRLGEECGQAAQGDPALHQHEEDERRLPVGQVERGGELRVHDHDLSHRGRREQYPPEPLNYVISRKMKAEREQYLLKPPNYLIHHKMTVLGPTERGAHKDRLGEECGQSAEPTTQRANRQCREQGASYRCARTNGCSKAVASSDLMAQDDMMDDTSSFQQLHFVVALTQMSNVKGFDRPWPVDTEPVWWQNLLEEGFEIQRTGFCMWTLADRVETQAMARMDERYSTGIASWIDGWRMRWDEESQAGRPVRWGPINEQECEDYVVRAENVLRKKWLEHTFPVACNNWALERYFAEFELHGTPEGDQRRVREEEEEEARATRLSRSRTPQRRGWPSASNSRDAARGLLNRRNTEETEEMALVVKKFLLKKKNAKSFRRLVDNPEAWRSGPGVTVTTSTRQLRPRRRPGSRECEESSGSARAEPRDPQ